MLELEIGIVNIFQLEVKLGVQGEYFAFYLYHENDVIERTSYARESHHIFNLEARGRYSVKVFCKLSDGSIESKMSSRVSFPGLMALPSSRKQQQDVVVYGIDKTSIFASRIIARSHNVVGIYDPLGRTVDGNVFGIPVLARIPSNTLIAAHENYEVNAPNIQRYALAFGRDDILSNELNRIGTIGLYRISRQAYLDGLLEGAKFLHGFIRIKYSCRAPYSAVIGEGTTLSLSGLGTAIHPATVIGDDCVIAQNVTLGGRAGKNSAPVIGNNVFIGPGAKCIGGRIGNNVVVGANSVVVDEIPDNCVVAGVPAKIISRDMTKYRGYTHRASAKSVSGTQTNHG